MCDFWTSSWCLKTACNYSFTLGSCRLKNCGIDGLHIDCHTTGIHVMNRVCNESSKDFALKMHLSCNNTSYKLRIKQV